MFDPRSLHLLCRAAGAGALLLALSTAAQAQIGWASFAEDTGNRMSGNPGTSTNDPEEKDYAWGDLDKDGWTDLVVVRKQPFTTSGRKVNVLFMNESGVLVDRTAKYASKSIGGGTDGFNTPTNDRDVAILDVDLDGWPDVLTSTTVSPGQPKSISHPRVYMNLGEDMGGNWLGLEYQPDRIPDFGTFPNFCGVGFGDVTGDGYPDLYFAHYEQAAQVDLDDRLLINQGAANPGFFTDESTLRMTQSMLESSFGTHAVIADMNGDGVNDVVKNTALGQTGATGPSVSIRYNDPANEGYFNLKQVAYEAAPYHVAVGDLNQDSKLDLVISDDGPDRYMINQGNDALKRVDWSPAYTYQVTDDGFGSNNLIVDLDEDGWNDVLICDVDVDIPGCERRMHVYHNLGGAVGGKPGLKEESGGGSVGASGLHAADLRGTHDVAVFDIDNDGDKDLVIGRCQSTEVWMNQLDPVLGVNYCGPAVTNSAGLSAVMSAAGSAAVADNDVTLTAGDMPANKFGYFLTSQTQGFVAQPPGSQGNLCLGGTIGRFAKSVLSSGALGTFSLPIDLTDMPKPTIGVVSPGETWNFQAWFRDNNPTPTSNFTDGLSILFH